MTWPNVGVANNYIPLIFAIAYASLGLPESTKNVDPFSHFRTAHGSRVIGHTRTCPFPLKVAPWHGATWTPSNTMIPWAQPSPHPEWHRGRFNRFCTAAERGLFNRIRHVAPVCTRM